MNPIGKIVASLVRLLTQFGGKILPQDPKVRIITALVLLVCFAVLSGFGIIPLNEAVTALGNLF